MTAKAFNLAHFDVLHNDEPETPPTPESEPSSPPPANDDIWTTDAIKAYENQIREEAPEFTGINLALYVSDTLRPRLDDICAELDRRKAAMEESYTKEVFRKDNQALLQHKSYMEGKIMAEGRRSNIALVFNADKLLASTPFTPEACPPVSHSGTVDIEIDPPSRWSLRGLKSRCTNAFNTAVQSGLKAGAAIALGIAGLTAAYNHPEMTPSPTDGHLSAHLEWQEKITRDSLHQPPQWLIPQQTLQTMQEEPSFAQKSIENWTITP